MQRVQGKQKAQNAKRPRNTGPLGTDMAEAMGFEPLSKVAPLFLAWAARSTLPHSA